MVNNAVVIPIATLSTIVGAGLIFIWWWFPRAWTKGNNEETDIMDEERRQTNAPGAGREDRVDWANRILADYSARIASEKAQRSKGNDKGTPNPTQPPQPQVEQNYIPPVTPH